jgi:TonB family protein
MPSVAYRFRRICGPVALAILATAWLAQGASPRPHQQAPPPSSQLPAPISTAELQPLADNLAASISAYSRKPKVLVADFDNRRGEANAFGQQLADALSEALQARLGAGKMLPRGEFQERMRTRGIVPADFRRLDVLQWNAAQAGATVAVVGAISSTDDGATLEARIVALPDGTEIFKSRIALGISPENQPLLERPATWGKPSNGPACQADHLKKGEAAPGTAMPKCRYCPSPSYTNAARKAKYQGNVTLNVEIDEGGRVSAAVVLTGTPYKLEEQAVKAVLGWQFEPATKDGQPVPVCVLVQVSFRLY